MISKEARIYKLPNKKLSSSQDNTNFPLLESRPALVVCSSDGLCVDFSLF
jgi:hypothetical protein